jgi:hypothetical protein
MKIWFKKNDLSLEKLISEQFLLLPFFSDEIINRDNDFKNSNWKNDINSVVEYVKTPDEADILVYPKKFDTGIIKYIELAKRYNKKVYSFYNDDNDTSVSIDDPLVLFRTSFYASKRKKNEYAMPAWSQDLFVPEKAFRKKDCKPTISFCGFISHPIRRQCLDILNQNTSIIKNFIIRNAFWGGSPHNSNIRNEYIDNITNSDFVLCCRGAGNFSYRLYETLSCGRIPIIIDTDCVYPCDDKINWSSISIFVTDLTNLNNQINTFWSTITENEYIELQKHIRQIYKKYIAPDGFTNYINYNITHKL